MPHLAKGALRFPDFGHVARFCDLCLEMRFCDSWIVSDTILVQDNLRKFALGACDRELELPRQPAKLPGGSLRGGWSTGAVAPNCTIALRAPQRSAFGCSPGTPPGPLREAPGGLPGAWSSALSALVLAALGARRVLFQRRARPSSLSPALARSLSLSL